MYKNVASQKIAVYAVTLSTGLPKTGEAANITAYIDKDGAGFNATNDTNPTEGDATNGKGIYYFDMTQAETNADMLTLSAVCSTSGVSLEPVVIYTRPATVDANVTQWKGTTAATADTAGYPVVTIKDGTGTGELNTASGAISGMALEATLTDMKGATFDTATDSLEAIRNAITALPAAVGLVYHYYPTAATRVTGGDGGGTYTDLAAEDGAHFVTDEVNTGTYLDVIVTLATGDTTNHPTDLYMPGYYTGAGTHAVGGYRWDYEAGAWETTKAFTMSPRTTEFGYRCGLYPRNVSGAGEVKIRFLHEGGTGNPSHALHLDMVQANFNSTDDELATAMAQILSLLQDVDAEVDNVEAIVEANLDATVSSRSTYAGGAVASVTAPVTVGTNNDKTGYALSAAGINAVTAAVDAAELEPGITWNTMKRRVLAFLTGLSTGGGQTASPKVFKSPSGTKDRISMHSDANGNRTQVVFDDADE